MTFIETAILSITFLFCLSIVWSSLRTGISPVPSSKKARQAILELTEVVPAGPIIELGSGWGQLAVALANKYPDRQVIGYELSPLPWLFSVLLRKIKGADNLVLKRRNFSREQLPAAALLVCFLYPAGMARLARQLEQQKPQVEMLISNTFALPGHQPLQTQRLVDLYRSPIYLYHIGPPQEQSDD